MISCFVRPVRMFTLKTRLYLDQKEDNNKEYEEKEDLEKEVEKEEER